MEMAVDCHFDGEACKPWFGTACATPDGEAGNTGQYCEITGEWKRAHDDEGSAVCSLVQTLFGQAATRLTPGRSRAMGVSMQEELIGTDEIGLGCPGQGLILWYIIGTERVVVEHKDRCQDRFEARSRPDWVGIFRGQYAVASTDFYQMLVLRFTTSVVTRPGDCPEIVVTRCPEDLGKTATEKT